MTSMAMKSPPEVVLGRGFSKISRRRAIRTSSCSAVPASAASVASSGTAPLARSESKRDDVREERGVVGVDLIELGFADLQLVEQPLKP
jgi:hypothetical protein